MKILIAVLGFVGFTLAVIGLADNEPLIALAGIAGLVAALMHEEIDLI